MPFSTLSVNGTAPADPLVYAGDGPTLIGNSDINTTLYLGQNNAISPGRLNDSIPLTPQSWVVVDGKETVYGITPGPAINVFLIPGGLAFFQSGISGGGFVANSNGAFFYNGTAGPGRLIVAITGTAASGIDPYGNLYAPGGIWVSNANGIIGGGFAINSNGAFFYNGAPGLGSLIVAITGSSASGVDQYGNVYQAGTVTIFDPATLLFPSKQSFEGQAALINSSFSPPAVNQFLQLLLQGPSTNVAGARDTVAIELNSASKDNSSNANCDFLYVGSNGVTHEYGYFDATGFNILVGSIVAAQPGITPAVGATFTNIPMTNGYGSGTNNGIIDNPQVRLMADNKSLQFKGTLACPATGSALNWGTIPAGFPNANLGGIFGMLQCANISGGTLDHIALHNNGVLSLMNVHNSLNFDISGVMATQ